MDWMKKLSVREIERRRKHLMGIQRQISKKKKKALVGQEFDLLLEGDIGRNRSADGRPHFDACA